MMQRVVAIWRVRTEGEQVIVHCVCACGHAVDAPISLLVYHRVMDDPTYQATGDCKQCDQVAQSQAAIDRWGRAPS